MVLKDGPMAGGLLGTGGTEALSLSRGGPGLIPPVGATSLFSPVPAFPTSLMSRSSTIEYMGDPSSDLNSSSLRIDEALLVPASSAGDPPDSRGDPSPLNFTIGALSLLNPLDEVEMEKNLRNISVVATMSFSPNLSASETSRESNPDRLEEK